MKKLVSAFLCTLSALSLAACGTAEEDIPTADDIPQAEIAETTSEQTETTTTTSAETTTAAEETTTTVTETEKVCTCESEFQHACCEYLNKSGFLAGGIYYGDINGNGEPEAVIDINSFGLTDVLYENENGFQVLNLETVSAWGTVRYIADTKQILLSTMYGHTTGTWGYTEYYIYDWYGSYYDISSSIFRESGYYYEDEDGEHSGYGQAYIDGKEVDNDTFEIKLDEIQKLIDENEYFPVIKPDDENFESYMKENFPCFDNWDIVYYNKN